MHSTGLLDSPAEESFDRITRAAAAALGVPSAALSLVDADRQFIKSSVGRDEQSSIGRQALLAESFCKHAVASGEPLVVEDARCDPLFKDRWTGARGSIVSYIGIPLVNSDGYAVGTLSVFDEKPRMWRSGHIQVLSDLATVACDRVFGATSRSVVR